MKDELWKRAEEVGKVMGMNSSAIEVLNNLTWILWKARMVEHGKANRPDHKAQFSEAVARLVSSLAQLTGAMGLEDDVEANLNQHLERMEIVCMEKLDRLKKEGKL